MAKQPADRSNTANNTKLDQKRLNALAKHKEELAAAEAAQAAADAAPVITAEMLATAESVFASDASPILVAAAAPGTGLFGFAPVGFSTPVANQVAQIGEENDIGPRALTTEIDALVGSKRDDTFTADNSGEDAVAQGEDTIDGRGGNDTLIFTGSFSGEDSFPVLTSVENVVLEASSGSFDLSGAIGLEAVSVTNLENDLGLAINDGVTVDIVSAQGEFDAIYIDVVGDSATTAVTVGDNVALGELGIDGEDLAEVTVSLGANAAVGELDILGDDVTSLTVNLGGNVYLGELEIDSDVLLTTLTLNSTGSGTNVVDDIDLDNDIFDDVGESFIPIQTLTITGGTDLNIDANSSELLAIDASAFTGALTVDLGYEDITVTGGSGDDTFIDADLSSGTSGSIIDGGSGTDTVVFGEFSAPGTFDDADFTNLTSIEGLDTSSSSSDISITLGAEAASASLSTITTGAGEDTITATDAYTLDSTISTGGGNDTIVNVGLGEESFIDGGGEEDTLVYSGSGTESGTIFADAGFTNVTSVEELDTTGLSGSVSVTLGAQAAEAGIDAVETGSGSDTITMVEGYTLSADLATGEGADTFVNVSLSSSTSGTTIDGGEDTDTLAFSSSGTDSATFADADFTNVTSVEVLDTTGLSGSVSVTLGEQADEAGIATVETGAGDDTITVTDLYALEANLSTGEGDDTFVNVSLSSSTSGTFIDGGSGTDTIEYTVPSGTTSATFADTDFTNLTSVETLDASALDGDVYVTLGEIAAEAGLVTVATGDGDDHITIGDDYGMGSGMTFTASVATITTGAGRDMVTFDINGGAHQINTAQADPSVLEMSGSVMQFVSESDETENAYDRIEINGLESGNQIRVSFVSGQVGDGKVLDVGDGLAVRIQQQQVVMGADGNPVLDAAGNLTYELTGAQLRADDEGLILGICHPSEPANIYNVRGLVASGTGESATFTEAAGQNRGLFTSVTLGTINGDFYEADDGQNGLGAYINAGMGDDTLIGGKGDDFMVGGAGNDTINLLSSGKFEAESGDDTVLAGAGDDTIILGAGRDFVDAGAGDDLVIAGEYLNGENSRNGADTEGLDSINGGADFDVIEISTNVLDAEVLAANELDGVSAETVAGVTNFEALRVNTEGEGELYSASYSASFDEIYVGDFLVADGATGTIESLYEKVVTVDLLQFAGNSTFTELQVTGEESFVASGEDVSGTSGYFSGEDIYARANVSFTHVGSSVTTLRLMELTGEDAGFSGDESGIVTIDRLIDNSTNSLTIAARAAEIVDFWGEDFGLGYDYSVDTLVANDEETITINTGSAVTDPFFGEDVASDLRIGTLVATDLVTLNIIGDGDVTGTFDFFGEDFQPGIVLELGEEGGKLETVDASSATGFVAIDASDAENDLTVTGGSGGFYFTGGSGDDEITGNSLAAVEPMVWVGDVPMVQALVKGGFSGDRLSGGEGDDTIVAGEGDDGLYGGGDADTLTGGDGADIFRYVFENDCGDFVTSDSTFTPDPMAPAVPVSTLDVITDFTLTTYDETDAVDVAGDRLVFDLNGSGSFEVFVDEDATVRGFGTDSTEPLSSFLDVIAAQNDDDYGLSIFQLNGTTYAYIEADGDSDSYSTGDLVIEMTGLVGTAGVTLVSEFTGYHTTVAPIDPVVT